MKIKELVVKKEVKLSVNYNTISSSVIITAELDENEDVEKVHEELSKKATGMLSEDIIEQLKLIK